MRSDGRPIDVEYLRSQSWQSQLGPLVLAAALPLVKFILIGLLDWYADRVTDALARDGMIERRKSR